MSPYYNLVAEPMPTVKPAFPPRRIAVLVDTATAWGRGIVSGISAFAREQSDWQILVYPLGQGEQQRLREPERLSGVIARIPDLQLAQGLAEHQDRLGLPIVNVSGIRIAGPTFPRACTDRLAWARLAADHLAAHGFQQFAFVAPADIPLAPSFRRAFQQALEGRGALQDIVLAREATSESLIEKLHNLPKPIGLLAWSTTTALEILDACHSGGIAVPDQISILAGDHDPLLSGGTGDSVLSGINLDCEGLGRSAAEMLSLLMSGLKVPEVTLVPPRGIEIRNSTMRLAVFNPTVARFVQRLREKACQPGALAVILGEFGTSRRSLERHLAKHLGHGPAVELRRVRIEHARKLLLTTDLPIHVIAERCGFTSPEYFAHAFRRETGVAPSRYAE